ncbi:hypothetical protein GGF46_000271 [Coemansia sp. RSA 552]|nr:hypothetical protein GGF46_000271 [Coemansia sp. RSA 552]
MGLPAAMLPLSSASDAKVEAVPQMTFSAELLSPAKTRALRQARRRRVVWISVELTLLLALLALLIVHSFRLHHKNDNAYARWSSSWVMILLSVLFVVVALALLVTFYHFRGRLAWMRDPDTTDDEVLNPQSREGSGVLQRLFGVHGQWQATAPQQMPPPPPWLRPGATNSRAWREMHAREHGRARQTLRSPAAVRFPLSARPTEPRSRPRERKQRRRRQRRQTAGNSPPFSPLSEEQGPPTSPRV